MHKKQSKPNEGAERKEWRRIRVPYPSAAHRGEAEDKNRA